MTKQEYIAAHRRVRIRKYIKRLRKWPEGRKLTKEEQEHELCTLAAYTPGPDKF